MDENFIDQLLRELVNPTPQWQPQSLADLMTGGIE